MSGEEKIISLLEILVDKVDSLGQRMDKLEHRMDMLEQRVDQLEAEVIDLRQNVNRINESVVVLEHEVRHDFKIICENSGDWNERNRQIDRLENKYEAHDTRIWALEQAVKAKNA